MKQIKTAFAIIIASIMLVAIAVPVLNSTPAPAAAQGTNLIQNPAMNGPYLGIANNKGQIPPNWNEWSNGEKPINDYHQFVEEYRSAPASWVQRCAFITCTAGGYQQVNGVEVGTTYRFTIWSFLWTCKNENDGDPCRDADGRYADTDSGARVRVGIDPTGGSDPNASTVLWGGYSTPWAAYGSLSVDAVAEAGSMTVFMYWTQAVAMEFNEVYWDDASLVALGEGEGTPLNSGASGEEGEGESNEPAPVYVPFVQAQSARPDGSLVHTVGEGDTYNSIYLAYREFVTRDQLLEFNGWELPPAIIVPGQEIVILPPGSIDPTTGQLLRAPGSTTSPTATPPPSTDAGQDTDTDANPTPAPTQAAPPTNDAGNDNTGSGSGGVGPSEPVIDPDVEKGGSLLPDTDHSPSFFFTI